MARSNYRNEREFSLYECDRMEQSDRTISAHIYTPERRSYSLKVFLAELFAALVVAAILGAPLAMYFWKGMK